MKFTAICENHLYQKAYAKGKRVVTPNLAVYVLPDYQAKRLAKAHPQKVTVNRIGLTVSAKLGGAVVRSRVRRIMRAALAAVMNRTPLKTGYLVVIAARHGAVNQKSTDLEKDLAHAFVRLSMVRDV